jgi:hypothetical protein
MSKKEIAVVDQEFLNELKELYPTEMSGYTKIQLPRIGFASQDKMEGTGKNKKVTTEAGTFFLENQSDKLDENGKKIWTKTEIGSEIEGVILYHRYQLSHYDEATESYSSTPVYDSKDETIPLWKDKKEIAKGTPGELKTLYQFVDKDGKTKSNLKENRIVYILYKNELHQLNLHGSSMFSFMTYARFVNPPTVLTKFSSEPQQKGQIAWNMMTFTAMRSLDADEIQEVLAKVKEIKLAIAMEKGAQPVQKSKDEIDEDEITFERLATGK